jgi:hypothetical protein
VSGDLNVAIEVADSASRDPFRRIGRQTLSSRQIRAAVVSASGAILDRCVLHLPVKRVGDLTGSQVDRQWEKLIDMLRRVAKGGAEGYFPELVLPGIDSDDRLPPLVHCSVPDVFFELPCPRCFTPLKTCRDDAFLAKHNLPLYSTSSRRLLACPKCSSRLKTPSLVDPDPGAAPASKGALILNAGDYLSELSAALTKDEKPKTPDAFRCGSCAERNQCWNWAEEGSDAFDLDGLEVTGAASYGPRWKVLTDQSVPYLLTRPAMIPFEQLIELIAGARGDSAEEKNSLLFAIDGSGIDALEILLLRLTALAQAVRALHRHHQLFGSPHLDVNSESLVAELVDPAPGLPTAWGFKVRLEPTSASGTVDLGGGVEVAVPSEDPLVPFFSSSVRDFLLTGNRAGEFRIDRVTSEEQGLYRLEGHLVDPRGVSPAPKAGDWFKLRWAEDTLELGILEAVGRPDPRAEEAAGRGNVKLTTEPLALAETAAEKIQRIGGVILPDVTYRVYPKFGPEDDLYSLAVVYFLSVLVNDSHDLGMIADELELLRMKADSRTNWTAHARDQVARNPDSWGMSSIFYDAVDRSGDRPNAIPEELWLDTLALGLRILGVAPDLSAEGDMGAEIFGRIGAEVDGLLRRMRALLFDRQALNLEIQTVVAELLGDEE